MNHPLLLFMTLSVFAAGCGQPQQERGAGARHEASDEPPMFKVDRNGTGPLTMEELDIHLPRDMTRLMTDRMEACYFDMVEKLAAEAGDPETLDPSEFEFLEGVDNWHELTRFGRRLILAQAIGSWAMIYC